MKRIAFAVVAVACAFMVFGCSQKKPKAAKAAPGLQRIHFDFDQSSVKPEYQPVMQGNAAWMQKHKKANLTVEGNCDSRGSVEYNIALGDRRAQSAKSYLMNLGIPANRLSTISYGKERPLCTQQTESCWWQNRRDDFVAH
jgi:peptidoglycan-associated lipoprotein